jgi:hypothetical protein
VGEQSTARLAQILHDIAARSRVTARQATAQLDVAVKDQFTTAFMERIEQELAPVVGSLMAEALADPNLPAHARPLLEAASAPTHQADSIIGIFAAFIGIFSIMGGIANIEIEHYLQHLRGKLTPFPLSPADAALAVLRGTWDDGDGRAEARKSGLSDDRFDVLLLNTGEPPSIQELLFLWRRGKIDQTRLERGIRQSRVRNEWIDAIELLASGPPSSGDALHGAVTNQIDDATAQRIITENGVDPSNYDWMRRAAGRPPGIMELLSLDRRGLATDDVVAQAIRESDIKDKYIPLIQQMIRHLMPERTVVSAIGKGVLTYEQGIRHLLDLGFSPEDAAALAAEAKSDKTVAHKNIAESQIATAYRDRYLDRDTAASMIVTLGYDVDETAFLLDLVDFERQQRYRDQVISATRSRYVGHYIDDQQVTLTLDTAGVPAATRDELLTLWALERANQVARLTRADLVKAHAYGILTDQELGDRLAALGYNDVDINIILGIEGLKPAPKVRTVTPPPSPTGP